MIESLVIFGIRARNLDRNLLSGPGNSVRMQIRTIRKRMENIDARPRNSYVTTKRRRRTWIMSCLTRHCPPRHCIINSRPSKIQMEVVRLIRSASVTFVNQSKPYYLRVNTGIVKVSKNLNYVVQTWPQTIGRGEECQRKTPAVLQLRNDLPSRNCRVKSN